MKKENWNDLQTYPGDEIAGLIVNVRNLIKEYDAYVSDCDGDKFDEELSSSINLLRENLENLVKYFNMGAKNT